MTQRMIQKTAGLMDHQIEGDEEQSPLSLWAKQYGLNDNVIIALRENDVNSLHDFAFLDNEQDIKDFVDSLGIKSFMIKKKLIHAINEYNNNDEKKTSQSLKTKAIEWEKIDDKITKREKMKIQSNKFDDVKIEKTNAKNKKMLNEYEYDAELDYSEFLDDAVQLTPGGIPFVKGLAVIAFTIIPILPIMHDVITYDAKKRLNYKKQHNVESNKFNDILSEIKQSEKLILPKLKELEQQEQKLNSHGFEMERFLDLTHESRVVMVIGPTGFGKSLVSNRLLGNEQDIDDIEESKQSDFQVAITGNTESVTNELTKKSKIVHMIEGDKKISYILSVVDTPGAFDSKGNDDDYNNMMSHYFAACGGINVFAVFFKFNGKMTSKYKELIKKYVEFFGEGLWNHCAIFITHCDMDTEKRKERVRKALKTTIDQIHSFLKEISNEICNDIPIYMFGENNFKESTSKFLSLLMDENGTFYDKYKCKNIRSPIDSLYEELQEKVKRHNQLLHDLQNISQQVEETKRKINNV